MPWWFYLLAGWVLCATVCAFWFGRALSNAEVQARAARQVLQDALGAQPPVGGF